MRRLWPILFLSSLSVLISTQKPAAGQGTNTGGPGIYKAKCAACHGADASGKAAAKIPSLVSDEAKKMSDGELAKAIGEKTRHPAGVKSLSPDQVKMVVAYIRSLKE